MDAEDIISNFFTYGCFDKEGYPLALRNCSKIHHLYMEELNGGLCTGCQQSTIRKKYEYRLKHFLKIKDNLTLSD
tara:strand:+ start:129 stop:353 length:225 start_codon:yes stop_codon:yes gene_type:complete